MSPLFQTLKSNLIFAVKCKNKSIYDSVMAEIDQANLTRDEIEELRSITLDEVIEEQIEPVMKEPKACLINDPTCESCSS